ncbi:MAG: hypothetical protein ACKPKP_20330 [Dolichospermum sp.]
MGNNSTSSTVSCSVVSGQWSVVSGQLSVVSGQWSVVSCWLSFKKIIFSYFPISRSLVSF